MLQTSLRHTEVAGSLFVLHFTTEVIHRDACERKGQTVIYLLTVYNPTWGVKIKNFSVKYRLDSATARICPWRDRTDCPKGGQEVTFPIPEIIPQQYWAGDAKTLEVRACVPDVGGCPDFNVTCTVHAEYDVRGATWDASLSPDFVSNLYVKVA